MNVLISREYVIQPVDVKGCTENDVNSSSSLLVMLTVILAGGDKWSANMGNARR